MRRRKKNLLTFLTRTGRPVRPVQPSLSGIPVQIQLRAPANRRCVSPLTGDGLWSVTFFNRAKTKRSLVRRALGNYVGRAQPWMVGDRRRPQGLQHANGADGGSATTL